MELFHLIVFVFIYLIFFYSMYNLYSLYASKNYKLAFMYTFFYILLLIFIVKYNNYCNDINEYIFDSGINGPTLLIVTGSHGNEISGPRGIISLLDSFKNGDIELKRGKVIMIPTLNKCGYQLGMRWKPSELLSMNSFAMDLNRNYPKRLGEEGTCKISNKVVDLINKSDYVLDFHDGYSFRRINPSSMGSGLYPGLSEESKEIANYLAESINKSIPFDDKDYRKFDSVEMWDQIPGSLRKYCDDLKKPYVLVETTGQTNPYPLKIRANQVKHLALDYCRKLGML